MAPIDAISIAANRRLNIVHRINEFAVVAEAVAAGGGLADAPLDYPSTPRTDPQTS